MNILLYTGSALPKLGGQEAVVDALARQYQQLGHSPIVLAPRPRLPMWPNDSHLPYPVLRHPRFFSTKHFVSWYKTFLLRAARKHKFDVIHCHDVYPTGYVSALCCKVLKTPLLITSHGGDVRAGNVRLEKSGMRPRFLRTIKQADALISIGQFTTDGFMQLGADPIKIHAIPNGVDLLPFAKPADRPTDLDPAIVPRNYFLFLGRLSNRKGLDVLLNALATLPATGGVELVIAGSGHEAEAIRQQIQQCNLQDRVKLVGRVSDERKVYLLQNALAVVAPSRGWEAFPLVVLEAYAAGRPIIGSRIVGLEDVVIEGETGKLVAPESPTDLAAAMLATRNDLQWAITAGQNAKYRVAGYSWETIARAHLKLYASLSSPESMPTT